MAFIFFQVVRALVQQAMQQAQQLIQRTMDVGKVLDGNAKNLASAWKGGDYDQFMVDHQRKVVAGFANLTNIFGGFISNLDRARQIVDDCERKNKATVGKLRDVFNSI
jgi:hypothetical protein